MVYKKDDEIIKLRELQFLKEQIKKHKDIEYLDDTGLGEIYLLLCKKKWNEKEISIFLEMYIFTIINAMKEKQTNNENIRHKNKMIELKYENEIYEKYKQFLEVAENIQKKSTLQKTYRLTENELKILSKNMVETMDDLEKNKKLIKNEKRV